MIIRQYIIQDLKSILLILCSVFLISCQQKEVINPVVEEEEEMEEETYLLPNIDLNNWKVTLPIGNPTEVTPPEILDYANNSLLKEFMYNDSIDGSLVFYTYPGATTTNSSYSRTELREQLVPGSNSVNWTFAEGGRMKGKLKLDNISKDSDGKYHRAIIMQIHGRLSNAQRDQIGEDDNNAPPVLKIYWNNERIRVHRKVLKDTLVNDHDILYTSSWEDEAFWFDEQVSFETFQLEIIASDNKLEIILNDKEKMTFSDIHTNKWGVFENYFKAGNYLVTTDSDAFSSVKYYELEVTH